MSTQCLPAWSIGADCYKEIPEICGQYGKTVAVIGGHTALEKAYGRIQAAVAGSKLELSEPIWYGGEASYENAEMLAAMDVVKNADMLFAVGGGRAVDTAKCAADKLNKPFFTFPTLASNCAGCTALCVMYYPDGRMRDLYYPKRCPQHTFMDTEIIANSPEDYLWAGIGDSLAKEFASEFASRNHHAKNMHAPLLGVAVARCCTGPLTGYGAAAMDQIRKHIAGYELEQATLAIVITAGLVSNLTIGDEGKAYFYNSSIEHGFYYGATLCPGSHKHLHGEVVSLGILVMLTLDKQFEKRDSLFPFYHSIDLPITLDQIEMTRDELGKVAEKAASVIEWDAVAYPITEEQFIQAIIDTDEAGKAYLASLKD